MKAWNKLAVGTLLAVGVSQFAVAQEKVTVFAAASLTNALQDIAAQYEGSTCRSVYLGRPAVDGFRY